MTHHTYFNKEKGEIITKIYTYLSIKYNLCISLEFFRYITHINMIFSIFIEVCFTRILHNFSLF